MNRSELQRTYSIGEAADILGISVPTLRMYEREGLIIPLRKSSRHRLYSESDLERIRSLRSAINREKRSIADIKRTFASIACWDIKHCTEESKKECIVCGEHSTPCWLATGKAWDFRSEHCRQCEVYTEGADCSKLAALPAEKEAVPS